MKTTSAMKELQQIRGIGAVLARRLIDAGNDSCAKVAALGDEGLKQFKGINPKAIPSILEQAAQLAKPEVNDREARIAALKAHAATLRQSVQDLTVSAKERFAEKLSGKTGKKLTEALVGVIDALGKIEVGARKRLKRTGKGLAKAQKRLDGLAAARLKDVHKGLKKARKALQRVQA